MSDSIKILLGAALIVLAALLCTQCHHDGGPASAAHVSANAVVATTPAALDFTIDNGQVTLAGRVPDQASRDLLVSTASKRFGAANVRDRLTIDGGVEKCAWLTSDAWLGAVETRGIAKASLDCGTLVLEGTVDTEATRAQVASAAGARLGPMVRVENRLIVRDTTAQQQIAAVLQLKSVEFESARAAITAAGIATLNEIIAVLNNAPRASFEIAGHTDSRGDPRANQALSQARADAVRDYLVSQGLAAERFTTKGYGADKPIADNSTAAGRRQNRRIEFVQAGG